MSLSRRPFGELEAAIMAEVWAHGSPMSVRDISTVIAESDEKAYTTVQTVTERLHAKGWLNKERRGKAFVYSASRSAGEYTAGLMEEALDASSDRSAALVRFAGHLSTEEADALRHALLENESAATKPGRRGR